MEKIRAKGTVPPPNRIKRRRKRRVSVSRSSLPHGGGPVGSPCLLVPEGGKTVLATPGSLQPAGRRRGLLALGRGGRMGGGERRGAAGGLRSRAPPPAASALSASAPSKSPRGLRLAPGDSALGRARAPLPGHQHQSPTPSPGAARSGEIHKASSARRRRRSGGGRVGSAGKTHASRPRRERPRRGETLPLL